MEISVLLSKCLLVTYYYTMCGKGKAEICSQTSVSKIITQTIGLNEIPQSFAQRVSFTGSGTEFRHLPFLSNKQSNDINEP